MTYRVEQEPIAIIGAACRFSGEVSSMRTLWDMISNVKTGHCKVPADRWDADLLHHPDPDRKGTMAVKHGYFLREDIGQFDAPFFATTAKEAAAMDPMKRLLLEVSYESLENAGIPIESLMNSQTGCYVGCMTNDYEMLSAHDTQDLGYSAATGTSEAMTANRVSWFFGMRGPSLTLDTACSSSLYALHLACQALKLGETDQALVAGVNMILYPNCMEQYSAIHMLSPEGISHSFDDRANGYGRGEGIGSMVVKRLSDAIRDGDTIRAVIRHSGVNADGKTPSITQPSSEAQIELIRRVYASAGLSLAATEYFESHGTGTPVGDPIELTALAATLGAARRAEGLGPLYVGSVKPNVGHTEGCSGLAGIFKAVLCLEKGMLVPTYDVQNVNPKLTLSDWNLALPPRTMQWPSRGPRRISVNSFGFGGANAHVILDDAYHYLREHGLVGNHSTTVHDEDSDSESGISMGPSTPSDRGTSYQDSKQLFVFSVRDQAGTQRISKAYSSHLADPSLSKEDPGYTSNLAYTLAARRSHHDFRTFAVASSLTELGVQLSRPAPKAKRASKRDRNLIFVFTGQGAQWPAMGKQLLSNPIFNDSVKASQMYLKEHGCTWDVFEELLKVEGSKIGQPEYSQTLCTVLQVALIDLLRHWKITPTATIGHSSGEIGAAYAASYLSHSQAVKIAYVRGICSSSVPQKGAMMAAGISREEAQEYLKHVPHDSAVVACVNSPSSVTLSGDVEAINALEKLISGDNKFARKLKVDTAYHSPHMRAVAETYLERMGEIDPQKGGETMMFSSLTGKIAAPEELNAQYWVDNMCSSVEFAAAFSTLLAHTSQAVGGRAKPAVARWGGLIEVGPHAALQGPVQQNIAAATNQSAKEAPYVSMIMRGKDANETALSAAGQLWVSGLDVDLMAVNGLSERSSLMRPKALTDLPTYPWNHNRGFWHEAYATRSIRFPLAARTDFLGLPEEAQNSFEPRWRNWLRISENPWIEDHKITGTILYPGAGMLVMALEGALQIAEPAKKVLGFRFRDVSFERGLVVTSGDEAAVETRLSFVPHKTAPDQYHFTVFSTTTGSSWTKHCFGTIALEYETKKSEVEDAAFDPAWTQQCEEYKSLQADASVEEEDIDDFYDHLESKGMEYGPLFRNVTSLSSVCAQKAVFGRVVIPDTISVMPANFEYPHVMHPATMDTIFHLLLATVNDGKPTQEAAVPYSLEEMFVAIDQPQGAGTEFHGYSRLTSKSKSGREVTGSLVISDEDWSAPKLVIKGFALRQVTAGDDSNATASEVQGLKKCVQVNWKQDIDFLQTSEASIDAASDKSSAVGELKSCIDLVAHKKAIDQVLVVMDDDRETSLQVLHGLTSRVGQRPGFGKLTTVATSINTAGLLLSGGQADYKLWDTACDEDLPTGDASYDLIVVVGSQTITRQPEHLAKLEKVLASNGTLVSYSASGLQTDIKTALQKLNFGSVMTVSEQSAVVVTNKGLLPAPEMPSEVHLLLPEVSSASMMILSSGITTALTAAGISIRTTTLTPENVSELAGKYVISLLEIESPLIYSWSQDQFAAFKSLISSVQHLFWITKGSLMEAWAAGVEFAPAQGLLRVMRNEYPLATLPHLDLSAAFDITNADNATMVVRIWTASLADAAEMEYAELHGKIHVPRTIEDAGLDGDLQLSNGTAKSVRRAIGDCKTAMKIESAAAGSDFLWVEDKEASQSLGLHEVEIETEFVGLGVTASADTRDDALVLGKAHEAVGVVTRCGSDVKSFVPGQRVVVFGAEACKTRIRQDQAFVAAVPANLLPENVAAISQAFITAQYILSETAALGHGQAALIHDAASALGQAAVQVAQAAGAEVFTLVETKEQKDILLTHYGVPPAHIFDSKSHHFVPAIQRITCGRGVDVVLTSQKGPAVPLSLSILNDSGYFFDLGTSEMGPLSIALPQSKCNASLIRVDMSLIQAKKPQLIKKLFQDTFTGSFAAIQPTNIFPVDCAAQAVEALRVQQQGSVVLSISKDTTILTTPPPAETLKLDAEGTYVLAGGLGALGLNIANMMVAHGAKHLVFLSRSGGSKNEQDLKRFEDQGVLAEAHKCDVNDLEGMTAIFTKLRSESRTIRGMVQCAMVLEDTIFDNMTHDKWTRAFRPKTRGSRNLLAQLSAEEKPFFILLSSITGVIGNTAQANYASGNSFEDALAHHARTHLGIAATSIDIGLVADSSHFTAAGGFGELKDYLHRYSHGWQGLQCTQQELQVALQTIMRGSTAAGTAIPAQFVLGLGDDIIRQESGTGFARDRKFDHRVVVADASSADGAAAKGMNVADRLSQATTSAEAATIVEEVFKAQIANAFGIETEEVDAQRPLPELGVDSLKAVEMRNRVLKEMQSDISVFELLSATPFTEVAAKIASRSTLVKANATKAE